MIIFNKLINYKGFYLHAPLVYLSGKFMGNFRGGRREKSKWCFKTCVPQVNKKEQGQSVFSCFTTLPITSMAKRAMNNETELNSLSLSFLNAHSPSLCFHSFFFITLIKSVETFCFIRFAFLEIFTTADFWEHKKQSQ